MAALWKFLNSLDLIVVSKPIYRTGGKGKDGTCDCIGMTMGAMEEAGHGGYPMHSSNYFARYQTEGMQLLASVSDCFLGMQVYKAKDGAGTLHERYREGGRYYTGDMLDYYHAGVVTSLSPFRITHCTSGDGVNGITHDTSLGDWYCGGKIRGLDYAAAAEGASIPAAGASGAAASTGMGEEGGMIGVQYVKVFTSDGEGVHVRQAPNDKAIYKYDAPDGTVLPVVGVDGDYYKVMYKGKARYVSRFHVHECAADGGRVGANDQAASTGGGGGTADLAALEQRVEELERLVGYLSERMAALEEGEMEVLGD